MRPEGRISALPPRGGLSSLEMGMGTASRALGVAMPTEMGESMEGGSWGGGSCLPPPTQASPGSGGASCIGALCGSMARGEPFRWGSWAASSSSAALQAASLAGLSRAFVLQVELNVKTLGDPNYYL